MGSIHEGHISLIRICQKLGYFSVVTIFVNPTQFNNTKILICILEIPRMIKFIRKIIIQIYYFFHQLKIYIQMVLKVKKLYLEYRNILCDIYRPGHFDGVTTVVKSLFDLIKPDHIFFGEKDFQQLKIIQKLLKKINSINNTFILVHLFECQMV